MALFISLDADSKNAQIEMMLLTSVQNFFKQIKEGNVTQECYASVAPLLTQEEFVRGLMLLRNGYLQTHPEYVSYYFAKLFCLNSFAGTLSDDFKMSVQALCMKHSAKLREELQPYER